MWRYVVVMVAGRRGKEVDRKVYSTSTVRVYLVLVDVRGPVEISEYLSRLLNHLQDIQLRSQNSRNEVRNNR